MHTIDINASQAEFILKAKTGSLLTEPIRKQLKAISKLTEMPWREVEVDSSDHYIISMLIMMESEKVHPHAKQQLKSATEDIAMRDLGIPTLESRNSDGQDFYDVSVWSIAKALSNAYRAGFVEGLIVSDWKHSTQSDTNALVTK